MEDYLKRLGYSIARGVPQAATGFVDLAALPFTMSGMINPEDVFLSTDYLTQKGLLPKPEQGLLNQTTELVSSAISPAAATKAGILATGGLLAGLSADAARLRGADLSPIGSVKMPKGLISDQPLEPGITAYHGSPYDFDKFQLDKIGTGEGAQAYGHGLYFTDSEDIAKFYKNHVLKTQNVTYKNKPIEFLSDDDIDIMDNELLVRGMVRDNILSGSSRDSQDAIDSVIYRLEQTIDNSYDLSKPFNDIFEKENYENMVRYLDYAKSLKADDFNFTPGKTYEVSLKPNMKDDLLDDDIPINQQSKEIQNKVGEIIKSVKSPLGGEKYVENAFIKLDDSLPGSLVRKELESRVGNAIDSIVQSNILIAQGKVSRSEYDRVLDREPFVKLVNSKINNFFNEDLGKGAPNREKVTSEVMKEFGIKGIKYKAGQLSGQKQSNAKNFVIFDDKDVNIKRKYDLGAPVAAGLLGYGLLDDEDEISLGQIRI